MTTIEITNVNQLPACRALLWFAANDPDIEAKLDDYGVTERVVYVLKTQAWVPVGVEDV